MQKTQSLPPENLQVLLAKGTEQPFANVYDEWDKPGTYLCRQCGLALFRGTHKFHSGCGWPSFDAEIPGTVDHVADADGRRTEILCARCKGHLGHVFHGENFTARNIRHCVNSLSLDFVKDAQVLDTEEAIFAAGCFWGVEALFQKLTGVVKTEVGYSGGHKKYPSYSEVCAGNTGHLEAVRVVYDPTKIQYRDAVKYFFEIHTPGQTDGQGPDIGEQYLSAVFYYDDAQEKIAAEVIDVLRERGYAVATQLRPVTVFWAAEEYHQNYYTKNSKQPYCHFYTKKF